MGANPTQAQAFALFLLAWTLIAAGFALAINYILVLIGIVALGASVMLFRKCRPWEEAGRS